MHSTEKFPLSLMIFGVIAPDYKSKLLFVEATIGAKNIHLKLD
jgi:hypothetical protein